ITPAHFLDRPGFAARQGQEPRKEGSSEPCKSWNSWSVRLGPFNTKASRSLAAAFERERKRRPSLFPIPGNLGVVLVHGAVVAGTELFDLKMKGRLLIGDGADRDTRGALIRAVHRRRQFPVLILCHVNHNPERSASGAKRAIPVTDDCGRWNWRRSRKCGPD